MAKTIGMAKTLHSPQLCTGMAKTLHGPQLCTSMAMMGQNQKATNNYAVHIRKARSRHLKEEGGLGHHTHGLPEAGQRHRAHISAVQDDGACLDLPQTQQNADQAAFPRTCITAQPHRTVYGSEGGRKEHLGRKDSKDVRFPSSTSRKGWWRKIDCEKRALPHHVLDLPRSTATTPPSPHEFIVVISSRESSPSNSDTPSNHILTRWFPSTVGTQNTQPDWLDPSGLWGPETLSPTALIPPDLGTASIWALTSTLLLDKA